MKEGMKGDALAIIYCMDDINSIGAMYSSELVGLMEFALRK